MSASFTSVSSSLRLHQPIEHLRPEVLCRSSGPEKRDNLVLMAVERKLGESRRLAGKEGRPAKGGRQVHAHRIYSQTPGVETGECRVGEGRLIISLFWLVTLRIRCDNCLCGALQTAQHFLFWRAGPASLGMLARQTSPHSAHQGACVTMDADRTSYRTDRSTSCS